MEVEKAVRSNGDSDTATLDNDMKNALNGITTDVNKILFPDGLQKPFPGNCLSLMTTTGAKGGPVSFFVQSELKLFLLLIYLKADQD